MLIEGVVTLPFIVLACLYSIRAVFSGKVAFDALSLTAILSVVHAAVLLVATACLAVFGVMLIMNKRRHIAQWTYLMIPLTLAEGFAVAGIAGTWCEFDRPGYPACRAHSPACHCRSVAA